MSTENNTSPQVWRVECDDGVREVTLAREGDGYIRASAADRTALAFHPDTPPRAAVATFAVRCGWPVVSVLAPGQSTRAELEARNAELVKERDEAVATEREEGGKLCDLCAQFARLMGDPHTEKYEELAAAIRAGSRTLLPLHVAHGDEEDRMDKSELIGFLHVCRARAAALRDMLDAILAADPEEFRRRADKHGHDLEHKDRYRLNGITSALTSGEEFPTLHVHESEGVDA